MPSKLKTLGEEVCEKILAVFTGLWVQSYEHEDAVDEIRRVCVANNWVLAIWDIASGMSKLEATERGLVYKAVPDIGDMTKAVKALPLLNHDSNNNPIAFLRDEDGGESDEVAPAILVLKNGHFGISSTMMIQLIANQIWAGKDRRQHLIILSPIVNIPVELQKLMYVIEHPLPDREQLRAIVAGVQGGNDEHEYSEPEMEKLIDSAAGLTRYGAEGACALSIVEHGILVPEVIFTVKAQELKKGNRAITLYEGQETFASIGGQDFLKQFAKSSLAVREKVAKFRPKGLLIMGVSGGGKSLFAKALGRETDRPTLLMDMGSTRGGIQGQTESNTREALAKADAMAPCILFIDEVEKALAGSKGGSLDAGTGGRQMGAMLTWLNDHESDVYVIATCNDITVLMDQNPEFARAGRFDGLFFVDFPGRAAKDQIWRIHLTGYGLLQKGQTLEGITLPDDTDWTGAEIESCCRLARLQRTDIERIGKILPRLVDQAADTIEATRKWASGKAYAAEYDGLYDKDHHKDRLLKLADSNGAVRRTVVKKRRPV